MNDTHKQPATVIVTGAAGEIGSAVTDLAVAEGYRVIAADQVPFSHPGVETVIVGDLRDQSVVDRLFTAATHGGHSILAMLHLAAIPSPGQYDDHDTLIRNTSTAYRVIAGAAESQVSKIVTVSSMSALGFAWAGIDIPPLYFPIDEEHPPVTIDTYGLSKLFMEDIAAYSTRRWGVPTVCLRFPFVGSGARLRARLDEVASDPMWNSREAWSWLDTFDAARSVLLAATSQTEGTHVINVVAPDTTSEVPTLELLERAFPQTLVRTDLNGHASLISTDKAKTLLGLSSYKTWRDH